jgi:hypothetical protein
MSKLNLRFSMLRATYTAVGVLLVTYIGLIAVVMTYAASTIAFTESVRNDEAQVAALEFRYLESVADITKSDYSALGYTKPTAQIFVRVSGRAALR